MNTACRTGKVAAGFRSGVVTHREDPPGLDGMVFVQDEPLVVPGDTAVVNHRLAAVLAVQFQPVQPVGGGIEADALGLRRLPEPGPAEWRLLMVSDGPPRRAVWRRDAERRFSPGAHSAR